MVAFNNSVEFDKAMAGQMSYEMAKAANAVLGHAPATTEEWVTVFAGALMTAGSSIAVDLTVQVK